MRRDDKKFMIAFKDRGVVKTRDLFMDGAQKGISQFFVNVFYKHILNATRNIQADVDENAAVYTHGGAALFAIVKEQQLEGLVKTHPRFNDLFKPVVTLTNDIDMSLAAIKPVKCDSKPGQDTCPKNKYVKIVMKRFGELRREIHNGLRQLLGEDEDRVYSMIKDKIQENIGAGLPIEDVYFVDSDHVKIRRDANNNILFNRYHKGRKQSQRCTYENMAELKTKAERQGSRQYEHCYPLRDSINTSIRTEETIYHPLYEDQNIQMGIDFVLCRIGAVMAIKIYGEAKPRFVSANFLDMGIIREKDRFYKTPLHERKQYLSDNCHAGARDALPYASLKVLMANTVRQKTFYDNEKRMLARDAVKNEEKLIVCQHTKYMSQVASIYASEGVRDEKWFDDLVDIYMLGGRPKFGTNVESARSPRMVTSREDEDNYARGVLSAYILNGIRCGLGIKVNRSQRSTKESIIARQESSVARSFSDEEEAPPPPRATAGTRRRVDLAALQKAMQHGISNGMAIARAQGPSPHKWGANPYMPTIRVAGGRVRAPKPR